MFATGGLRPDRTILLDVPVEIGLERKAPDDQTRFESGFDVDFHQRVRSGFMRIAAADPSGSSSWTPRRTRDHVAGA